MSTDLKISIHAPSRERLDPAEEAYAKALISIHAPSRERQPSQLYVQHHPYHFNPRSLAGATVALYNINALIIISIHAPSRERLHESEIYTPGRLISIHAPLRERLGIAPEFVGSSLFQSTLPCGSDWRDGAWKSKVKISIHAPLRERPSRKQN